MTDNDGLTLILSNTLYTLEANSSSTTTVITTTTATGLVVWSRHRMKAMEYRRTNPKLQWLSIGNSLILHIALLLTCYLLV